MNRLSHLVGLIVFCLTFTFINVNAQSTITVGTGTAFSETFPLNGYYNYSWSNSIYLANQIGKSGSLSSIAFYIDNTSTNVVLENQKIYARHTSATAYSNSSYSGPTGFTLIYDGTITINGAGWKTINLTTPFNYNGTENLEFLFENRDGSYVTTFPYYRYTSTGTGAANIRTKRDYQDATFPSTCYTCGTVNAVPNMQFTITPCTFNSGIATPTLASVVPGNTATVTLSDQAAGSSIQWQSSDDNLLFTNISGAIDPIYSETIYSSKYYRVILTNTGCSKVSTTAIITADLSTMITKSIGSGTAVTEKYPFNEYYNNSWSNMIYKASDIQGSGKLSRVSFNVSNSPVNVTMPNQKIYVKTVPNTTVAYTTSNYPTTAGFTLVYDGPITFNGSGWKEIVFNKGEFYYNGTDNLEFLFESRNGAYTNDYPTFYTSIGGQTDYSLRRDYKDYDFPSTCYSCGKFQNTLNIRLSFFPCTSVAGTASAENPTVCTSNNTTIKLLGTTTGSTIQWQSSTNNSTFTDVIGATTSTYITPNLSVTTYYKAVVKKGVCTTTSNTVTVTVSAAECLLTTSEIGTGTVTFDKYPFNGYYDYSWASMLYKASEINSTGKLARVSFYVDNDPVNETMNNQKIYVRHANTSEYTDAVHPTTAGFTLVYDGSITYNGSGWKEIAFQNQFEYNGVDDLEFLFENRDGSWTATHPIFRGQGGMSQDRVKRDYNDVTFPATCVNCAKYNNILNIKMKFIPCSINGGTITATATNVKPLENVQLTLTGQENAGTIQWEQSTDNVTFTVVPNQNGNTLTIPMTVSNLYLRTVTKVGCSKYSNVVTITPDNCFQVSPQIGNGILESYKFPFNVWYDYSWSSTIYTKEEVGPAGKIASMSFNVTNSPVNYVTNNQKIYVRKTDARQFDDATYSGTTGFTNVFEGTITYNGQGWKEIVFTTPFEYDGTSNLEFLFENRDGSYGESYPTFAYTDGQILNRTKRDYADVTFPATCVNCLQGMNVPNTKFKFLAPVNVAGTVSATETSICTGQTSVLSISGQVAGSTVQWQSSSDNVSFVNVDGATTNTYTTGEITATTYYRATVSVGACSVNSAVVTIALNCTTKMIIDENSGSGSVEVDISSITDKVGPYNYIISELPIPELTEEYHYLRDTIYGDTIPVDSVAFFLGNHASTKYTFENLQMENYYVAVFDSRGRRIFDKQVFVQPTFIFETGSGLIANGNSIVSNQANAKGTLPFCITEESQGVLNFTLTDFNKTQYYGLLPTETTIANSTSLKYGFSVIEGKVYTVENGVTSTEFNVGAPNMELILRQSQGNLEYVVGGKVKKSIVLPTTEYILKSGFGLDHLGASFSFKPTKIILKKYSFKPVIRNGNCSEAPISFNFNVSAIHYSGSLTYHYNITSTNGFSFGGIGHTMSSNLPVNCSAGIYTISGTITLPSGSNPATIPFSETIYVGYETEWPFMVNYEQIPNNNSLKRTTTTSISDARAKNILEENETGWIVFEPQMLTSSFDGNYFTFSQSGGSLPSAPVYTNTYFRFEKITNATYRVRSIGYAVGGTTLIGYVDYVSYSAGTNIRVMVKATTLELWINGVLKRTLARPTGLIRLKANSKLLNDGFKNIVSSFGCPKQTLSTVSYAKLVNEITTGYSQAIQGTLRFYFEEEYKIGEGKSIPLKIYKLNHHELASVSFNGVLGGTANTSMKLAYNFDDNRYSLPISSCGLTIGEYYILEVSTSTGEKRYLKFLYTN